MILYPAIDMKDGKCVRLSQGKFSDVTVYGEDPVKTALNWQEQGGEFVHLVDLDGALKGKGVNRSIILEIAKMLRVPVQTGGGIRTPEDVEELLSGGVSRVILGTAAVQNPQLVSDMVHEYGDKIAVGIDAKDGLVAISGWEEVSAVPALDLAAEVSAKGVKTIIYTDIATDGMLTGPNFSAMRQMAKHVAADIIASGGVSSTKDLLDLLPTGVSGAIIGKALYTGRVDLTLALNAVRSAEEEAGLC